jgi:hypothetical protein
MGLRSGKEDLGFYCVCSHFLFSDCKLTESCILSERGEPSNQELGSVATAEGRCIAFPNLFQHRVSPFQLSDPSKPGRRKIVLVFFLVNPSVDPIPSTTDIPPQQKEWGFSALWSLPSTAPLRSLPSELIEIICDQAGLMSRTEAEACRLELMKERTAFVDEHDSNFFSQAFNMCEQ